MKGRQGCRLDLGPMRTSARVVAVEGVVASEGAAEGEEVDVAEAEAAVDVEGFADDETRKSLQVLGA